MIQCPEMQSEFLQVKNVLQRILENVSGQKLDASQFSEGRFSSMGQQRQQQQFSGQQRQQFSGQQQSYGQQQFGGQSGGQQQFAGQPQQQSHMMGTEQRGKPIDSSQFPQEGMKRPS
jgi:hypothetical protein